MPDPALHFDPELDAWAYTEPDWAELRSVVTGHGPASQARIGFRQARYDESRWVRQTILAPAGAAA